MFYATHPIGLGHKDHQEILSENRLGVQSPNGQYIKSRSHESELTQHCINNQRYEILPCVCTCIQLPKTRTLSCETIKKYNEKMRHYLHLYITLQKSFHSLCV